MRHLLDWLLVSPELERARGLALIAEVVTYGVYRRRYLS